MSGVFPNDENGRVLSRMQESGDDLSRPRDIEFTVIFPSQILANRFADHFRRLQYRTSIEQSRTVPELPWDVVVVRNMIPAYHEISEFEEILGTAAIPFSGRNDGWGCLTQPVQH